MPRDYKHTGRGKSRRKAPAASSWRGFASGFATGVLACAAVFVAVHLEWLQLGDGRPTRPVPHVGSPGHDDTEKPRFEFYTMLPEMEVAVKEEEIAPRADKDEETAESAPLSGAYLLQVGSFRRHEEADSLKASLALLGLEAEIQTVSIDGEQTWHRVRLGPFTDRARLNDARQRLSENSIEAIVLKKRS